MRFRRAHEVAACSPVRDVAGVAGTAAGFFAAGMATMLAGLLFRGFVVSNRPRWRREEYERDVDRTVAERMAAAQRDGRYT